MGMIQFNNLHPAVVTQQNAFWPKFTESLTPGISLISAPAGRQIRIIYFKGPPSPGEKKKSLFTNLNQSSEVFQYSHHRKLQKVVVSQIESR